MLVKKFVKYLDNYKIPVILFWVFLTLLVGFFAMNIMNQTNDSFTSEKGTDSYYANELLQKYFPEKINEESHIIIVYDEGGSVIGPKLAVFTQSVYLKAIERIDATLLRVDGYYIYNGTEVDSIKQQFVSDDLTTSILVFTYDTDTEGHNAIVEILRDIVREEAKDLPSSYEVYTVGFLELFTDTLDGIENDMRRIDVFVIPIVFLFLVIILRNWKYFIITMIPILMTIITALGLLERHIELNDAVIPSYVLSLLLSITLGIGVDYNLFLLSRFREERLKGKNVIESVEIMMKNAGHTVLTSGLTLIISIAALMFFPLNIISSIGIGITLSISLLLLTNLTFTPALLLLIGSWTEPSRSISKKEAVGEKKPVSTSDSTQSSGYWYKVGKIATKHNFYIIIIVLLLTLPLSFQLLQQNAKSQSVFYTPDGSDSRVGFGLLEEKFGAGAIMPLELIVVPINGDVWSEETFLAIQQVIQKSIERTAMDGFSFLSHAWMNGSAVPYELAMAFRNKDSPYYNTSIAAIYRAISQGLVSQSGEYNGMAALIQITLKEDPFSSEAGDAIDEIFAIATEVFGDSFDWGLTGTAKLNAEAIETTYDSFPIIILLVAVIIYILVALMFRAVFLPLRLLFTIGLTISFIFGATRIVFETTTFLNSWFPLLDDIEVTFWMIPVLTFSLILGLGMDYDIFTIERIRENIKRGLENDEAIAHGLEKTGGIITGAGIIMMIAFGGLMFSSIAVLVQFGFVLTFAVFLDTFVVRTLLVPAIMSMGEKHNWWPSKIGQELLEN